MKICSKPLAVWLLQPDRVKPLVFRIRRKGVWYCDPFIKLETLTMLIIPIMDAISIRVSLSFRRSYVSGTALSAGTRRVVLYTSNKCPSVCGWTLQKTKTMTKTFYQFRHTRIPTNDLLISFLLQLLICIDNFLKIGPWPLEMLMSRRTFMMTGLVPV